MIARILVTTAALITLPLIASAEDPAGWIEELRALRQMVEQQSKQLDALTRQVAKLAAAAAGRPAPKAEPAPTAATPTPPPTEEFSITAPKAEPAGPPHHIIVKGETLTSIAKHYNIPVADLQKANKDVNPGKLQIGQAIIIPAVSNPKNPEPTPEKKENP